MTGCNRYCADFPRCECTAVVRHIRPPIPDRRWDYEATWPGHDPDPDARHPVGHGPTEAAAIEDLQIETEMRA